MDLPRHEAASFRDPAGRVFHLGNRVLRSVSTAGAANYEFVKASGLLHDLTADGQVVETREVPTSLLGGEGGDIRYLLEHPRLSFISYPYEWCFSALKAAALLHLDLLLEALERNITLSDASAYNVQFSGTHPVFIDVLSFCPYRDGDYWLAHRQFCDQFVNPLLLTALRGVGFNGWFRGSPEGIAAEDLSQILPWYQKLRWNVLTHVVLPVRFQAKAQTNFAPQAERIKTRRLPRMAFKNMLLGLRRWIENLQPAGIGASKWADYAISNTYENSDAAAKAAFVQRFAKAVKPAMLWDFGCNQGGYSESALEAGAGEAIGFDSDRTALEAAFDNASKKNLKLLPLFLDAADPSPAQGWRGQEHMSLKDRSPADGLLALAFVHHLVIGRNIPLAEAVSWLIGLAPEGVIEFVEKDDPTIGQMLTLREDIFCDYHREAFLAAVRAHAEIVEQEDVIQNRRLLVWYRRRR